MKRRSTIVNTCIFKVLSLNHHIMPYCAHSFCKRYAQLKTNLCLTNLEMYSVSEMYRVSQINSRSTVKAANRKFISFMSFENITFIYRAFQVWAWPLLDKRSASKEYILRLTDSIYKLVTWCVGHVVLVNNPILFRSHLIFDSARA